MLLDARAQGAEEPPLRAAARQITASKHRPFSSRSYRCPYALLAFHDQPVGVDIERVTHVDERFARSICTPAEVLALPPAHELDLYVTSMWCSKEALTKGLGDAVRYDPRRVEAPMLWAGGRAGAWRAAELQGPPGHVLWLCWRERRQPASRDGS